MSRSGFPSPSIHRIFELIQKMPLYDQQRIFETIVGEAVKVVEGGRSDLFILDESGERIRLVATTDPFLSTMISTDSAPTYERKLGEGLTGWIFKTGKPLCIADLGEFRGRGPLAPGQLKRVCGSSEVDDEDRTIRWRDKHGQDKNLGMKHFLGVPIKSQEGEVVGVLRVSSIKRGRVSLRDLRPLFDLSTIISMVLFNERQKRFKEVLIRLGAIHEKTELFECVVRYAPGLVLGKGCSIFLLDSRGTALELAYTNSPYLKDLTLARARENALRYAVGAGKTGLVAELSRTLIVNYYGRGEAANARLQHDSVRWSTANNIVHVLNDGGRPVGLFRLHRNEEEPPFSAEEHKKVRAFLKKREFSFPSLMGTPQKHLCETGEDQPALSFLSLPIKDVHKQLLGTIRIPRTFTGSIFTDDDVAFMESLTNRLTIVLEKERFFKARLNVLSDINSRINSSVDQDAILDRILEAATDTIGFEFATIQLADESLNTVWTAKGRKNSHIPDAFEPRWVGSLRHPLNPEDGDVRDIHAWLLVEKKDAVVLQGWNEHFDRNIYDDFHHEGLIRAFVPIVAFGPGGERKATGTIEAGHNVERKNSIDDMELTMLKALADQAAIAINNERLRQLEVAGVWKEVAQVVPHKMTTTVQELPIILDNLKVLLADATFSEPQNRSKTDAKISRLERTAAELLDFLRELGRFSSEQGPDLVDQNLRVLLQDCIDGSTLCGRILLDCDSSLTLWIDPAMIAGCIKELLLNASHFLGAGSGRVTLVVREVSGDQVTYPIAKADSYVMINVRDTGPGVAPEHKEHVFDLFFSGRSSSGIGLAMVRKVIHKHGGVIHEVGTSRAGADFEICLPKKEEGRI